MDPLDEPRKRPFGVIIVALLQLGTVVVAMIGYFASVALPWEGTFSQLLTEHAWARVAILVVGILVAVATVGMWYLKRWGWALMITLVGLSLVLDLTTWASQGDQDRHLVLYLRMGLDVVSAFYLNSSSVQAVFHDKPRDTAVPGGGSTASAGRVDE